jgi:hypothetical protein
MFEDRLWQNQKRLGVPLATLGSALLAGSAGQPRCRSALIRLRRGSAGNALWRPTPVRLTRVHMTNARSETRERRALLLFLFFIIIARGCAQRKDESCYYRYPAAPGRGCAPGSPARSAGSRGPGGYLPHQIQHLSQLYLFSLFLFKYRKIFEPLAFQDGKDLRERLAHQFGRVGVGSDGDKSFVLFYQSQ